MTSYKGMNFREWCKLDEYDERKINYTLWDIKGKCHVFTSEDIVSWEMLYIVRNSVIEDLKLLHNEWFVEIRETDE